jgi:SRSO17 transposase
MEMDEASDFERYLEHLCGGLGRVNRHAGLMDYCRGLMLPIARKSVEPLAAHLDPLHVPAKHQSLHHFVAQSDWSDASILKRVRDWVVPTLQLEHGAYWIIDDTGHPKQGKHSVGVARQYCGQLGKTDNCQIAVSLSLASETGSLPIAYQLYLPKDWADDNTRRTKTGVPKSTLFATKPAIALEQIRQAKTDKVPTGTVLADAAYGDDTAFRDGITELGLDYALAVRSGTTVWAPGVEPLPPKPWSGKGRKPKRLQRGPGHEPETVKDLALRLPASAYKTVTWREGTNADLTSRFSALRVRPAHRDYCLAESRPEEWLLIEWPEHEPEPVHYWLSTLPEGTPLEKLIQVTLMRWRIERDYRELKQEFGLSDYEGRGWRGFHHHATLCIAAYGYLTARRLSQDHAKKNFAKPEASALPKDYVPRGRPTGTTSCT